MPRVKSTSFKSRFEFEEAVNRIAKIELEIRELGAERDKNVQKIQETFKPLENELQAELKGWLAQAEKYADEHRGELFPNKAKSSQTPLAFFGYRLGNPTLTLLNKQWSWADVVRTLKERGHAALVQLFEEPRKDVIKTAPLTPEELAALGMKITQSETFFIEPKLEGADAVKAAAVVT